jgi:hypothetical protein
VPDRGDVRTRLVPDRGDRADWARAGSRRRADQARAGSRRRDTLLRSCPPGQARGRAWPSSFTSLRKVSRHLDQRRSSTADATVPPTGARSTHGPARGPAHGPTPLCRARRWNRRGHRVAAGARSRRSRRARSRARRRGTRADAAARCPRPGTVRNLRQSCRPGWCQIEATCRPGWCRIEAAGHLAPLMSPRSGSWPSPTFLLYFAAQGIPPPRSAQAQYRRRNRATNWRSLHAWTCVRSCVRPDTSLPCTPVESTRASGCRWSEVKEEPPGAVTRSAAGDTSGSGSPVSASRHRR